MNRQSGILVHVHPVILLKAGLLRNPNLAAKLRMNNLLCFET